MTPHASGAHGGSDGGEGGVEGGGGSEGGGEGGGGEGGGEGGGGEGGGEGDDTESRLCSSYGLETVSSCGALSAEIIPAVGTARHSSSNLLDALSSGTRFAPDKLGEGVGAGASCHSAARRAHKAVATRADPNLAATTRRGLGSAAVMRQDGRLFSQKAPKTD